MPNLPVQQQARPPLPLPGGAQSVSVTLNGSGNGMVSLGPQRVKEHWQVTSVSVQVAPVPPAIVPTNEAQCSVYLGVAGGVQGQFFGQTFTGSTGDTCGVGQDIQPGQVLTAVWTGGDPGATATMAINGTYTTGPPPS